MPRGMIETPADENIDTMSAPSSADFLTQTIYSTKPKTRMSKPFRAPILRGLHQKEIPTLDNGLVDIESLRMYMHRNSLSVPLYKTPGWKYHHVNHPKSAFEQEEVDVSERNQTLRTFRRSSWQQVHMRVTNEMIYHWVHQIEGELPRADTIEASLRDFEMLDMLGAASLFLNLYKGNSQYSVDRGSIVPIVHQETPLVDKLSFISEVRDDYARAVMKAEILPERLVTSAVKRLSLHLKDPYLTRIADRRLASDPVFYPVRVPSHQTLLDKARRLISLEFEIRNEPVRPLQTGMDEVEMAA